MRGSGLTEEDGLRVDRAASRVIWLHEAEARRSDIVGAKAAGLAAAGAAGLSIIDGFVLPPEIAAGVADHRRVPAAVRVAWERLSENGRRPLVVRSSSSAEDGETSSAAGVFDSVTDVRTWTDFVDAVATVVASAEPGARSDHLGLIGRMSVLVQGRLDPAVSGVLFGVDPISGRTDRIAVAAVEGNSHDLVGGEVDGARYLLTHRGRVVSAEAGTSAAALGPSRRRALAALAARTAAFMGGPQDVEWAFDDDGRLWVFQSRPVTAVGSSSVRGPVLGPGPVAESFPSPLHPLEQDLWIVPLRHAVAEALLLTGSAGRRKIAASPVVTTVGGFAVADLELLGVAPGGRSLVSRLDPRPQLRRLAAAWRVGRLRTALPRLAGDLMRRVDDELTAASPMEVLSDDELLSVLDGASRLLVALHGHEVLAGMLREDPTASALGFVALRALAAGRAEGFSDEAIATDEPAVLALVPPSISGDTNLPPVAGKLVSGASDRSLSIREGLRLRIRWVQELGARASWELGVRLAARGIVAAPGDVRRLRLDELRPTVSGGSPPRDWPDRAEGVAESSPPAAFRMALDGRLVPEGARSRGGPSGQAAGGGRGQGRVHHGREPRRGDVLVVKTLDPQLASLLPGLGGLVAETGNALSHLAILARELSVPTVVGVAGARDRFPAGSVVVVDGLAGEVALVSQLEGDAS
jgi:phosphohistidine swiveling domain-containing protein